MNLTATALSNVLRIHYVHVCNGDALARWTLQGLELFTG